MRKWIALIAALALFRVESALAAYYPEPVPVIGGGTGLATLTAHALLVGEGTSNVALVGPGATAGVPLVSGGASADPSFTTAVVAGGGTGLATLTAHAVILGEGTSNVAFVSPAVDSVVAWAGSASADPAALAIGNCATALTYSTGSHTFGCNASAGVVPTYVSVATATPITLAATNLLTTVVNTTGGGIINLPTAAQNLRTCVKDGIAIFGTNSWTVKASGTIDGTAGATGIVMNQNKQELCFASYDGTNWVIE